MPELPTRNEIVLPSDPAEPKPRPEPEPPPASRKAELENAIATARARVHEFRNLKRRANEMESELSEAEREVRRMEQQLVAEFPPPPAPIPSFESMMDESKAGAERYTYRERQQVLAKMYAGVKAPQPPKNDLPEPPMPIVRETRREDDPVFGRPGPAIVNTAKPHYDLYDFRNGLEDHA